MKRKVLGADPSSAAILMDRRCYVMHTRLLSDGDKVRLLGDPPSKVSSMVDRTADNRDILVQLQYLGPAC